MIGHVVLRRCPDDDNSILGLKVTGGHLLPNGKIGAIIEKVKPGSIADREGHLKPGKPTTSIKKQNNRKNYAQPQHTQSKVK